MSKRKRTLAVLRQQRDFIKFMEQLQRHRHQPSSSPEPSTPPAAAPVEGDSSSTPPPVLDSSGLPRIVLVNERPFIEGTQISVESILRKMASGYSHLDVLETFPALPEGGVRAALDFAAGLVRRSY